MIREDGLGDMMGRAEEMLKKLKAMDPKELEKLLGGINNSKIMVDIIEEHKKNFKGDYEAFLIEAGIAENDSPILKVHKINELEKKNRGE